MNYIKIILLVVFCVQFGSICLSARPQDPLYEQIGSTLTGKGANAYNQHSLEIVLYARFPKDYEIKCLKGDLAKVMEQVSPAKSEGFSLVYRENKVIWSYWTVSSELVAGRKMSVYFVHDGAKLLYLTIVETIE